MKLVAIFTLIIGGCFAVSGQNKQPAAPSKPFVIKSKTDLADITKQLADQDGNQEKDIVSAKGMQLRVAVFHDAKRENEDFEVHDITDDIYYVLEGKATLILGGELVAASEISPGEWRSKKVNGGHPFEIKKGNLVVIPRGTVHQRTVTKKGFSMILIKVFASNQ